MASSSPSSCRCEPSARARACVQVRLALEVVFEGAQGSASPDLGCVTGSPDGNVLRVCDVITLTHTPAPGGAGKLALEWEAGSLADTVADAVVAVVMQVGGLHHTAHCHHTSSLSCPPLPTCRCVV